MLVVCVSDRECVCACEFVFGVCVKLVCVCALCECVIEKKCFKVCVCVLVKESKYV